MFIAGPHDNAPAIRRRLITAAGGDGFDEIALWGASELHADFEEDWEDDASAEDVAALPAP